MAFFKQLGLLLWKNALKQWRKKIMTLAELLLPLMFAVVFMSLRGTTDGYETFPPSQYRPYVVPSTRSFFYVASVLYTPNSSLVHHLIHNISYTRNRLYPLFPSLGFANSEDMTEYYKAHSKDVVFGIEFGVTPDDTEFPDQMSLTIRPPSDTWKTQQPFPSQDQWLPRPYIYPVFPSLGFANSEDMTEYYKAHSKDVVFGIEFGVTSDDTEFPDQMSLTIRPPSDTWKTQQPFPSQDQWLPRPYIYPEYEYKGFLVAQRMIYEGITRHQNPNSSELLDGLQIVMQRMPYPSYSKDKMSRLVQELMPFLIMLSFIFIAVQTTKDIVDEKEKRLKEYMKLMGLKSSAYWASWFLVRFIQVSIAMAMFTVLCCVDMTNKGAPLVKSDPTLIFVFLLCYGVAVISFCFMVSAFVKKGSNGAAITGIVFFISYCPYLYIAYAMRFRGMTLKYGQGYCVVFNLSMAFGAYLISLYEGFGEGVQWWNFHISPSASDDFSLLHSMFMLLLDTAIHIAVTWYADNVITGDFGVPKPWNFLFKLPYWCGEGESYDVLQRTSRDRGEADVGPTFEVPASNLEAGISIRNLKKAFENGSKTTVAVDRMNLDIFKDQITVLLGQNGAGKTTTISILTGFSTPSEGTAVVNGHDIQTDMAKVRRSLGYCPQHNILFDTMTVREHLLFFAGLKKRSGEGIEKEVRKLIAEAGLTSKENTPSQHLSGGQKRKLSVCIALIGGSEIVILDEPSSGMDPAARRQTWDILQRNRQGRTMLLTTHFMDEADLLGDRIAIMAEGVVKCCGTSYFLKKLYGTGYHLVMVKTSTCDVSAVSSIIQSHIPTATLEHEIASEVNYLLPESQVTQFANLLSDVDKHREELGIESYGIKTSTVEEAFLKVANESSVKGVDGRAHEMNGETHTPTKDSKRLKGVALLLARFKGLLMKKALHTWRNRVITVVQILLPLALTIMGLVVVKIGKSKEVPLTLNLDEYGETFVSYWGGNVTDPLAEDFQRAYSKQFIGTRDVFQDIQHTNRTSYFLGRANDLGTDYYSKEMMIGAEFFSDKRIIAYYNAQPYHAEPISLSYAMNGILKQYTSSHHEITTINNPFPALVEVSFEDTWGGEILSFVLCFCVFFGMTFLTSTFVHLIIKERTVGVKHLQLLSGVRPIMLLVSNFVWDLINYMTPVFLMLVAFAAFQIPAYTDDGRLGVVFLVMVVYGLATLPFMYTIQYLFTSPATGVVVIIILNVVTGLMSLMTVYMMHVFELEDVSVKLDWVFSVLFLHHNFGKSFEDLYNNYIHLDFCVTQNRTKNCANAFDFEIEICCKDKCEHGCLSFNENYLGWETPGLGRRIAFMLMHCVIFSLLTLCIEHKVPQKIWSSIKQRMNKAISSVDFLMAEDDYVSAEKTRVGNMNPGDPTADPLILKNLTKHYGSLVAVDGISIGVSEGECFGLLGQNGAGKTTTFKMLTGDMMATSGHAFLWHYDITKETRKVQENMGYCPQFDALLDYMTGRETLMMFARLKGVPESSIPPMCDKLFKGLELDVYADRLTSDYSGGNKRKLSTAIALTGNPGFILLDEPTTGMDPKGRRLLWNVLSEVRGQGRTLVLTSHSMEDCDALCTNIAIMANGTIRCLGTPQHLKNSFGQGYTVIVRMKNIQTHPEETLPESSLDNLKDFISSEIPETQVFDDHQGYVHFQMSYTSVSLAKLFSVMEDAKARFSVEDYSVQQTTLEEVFLKITRCQSLPKEKAKGCCRRLCC